MKVTAQLARFIRDLHFGNNWTSSSLKENLADLTWQQATASVHSLNTVAALVYHTNYFVVAVNKVLEGGPLDAHDKFSFDLPPITSEKDWRNLVEKALVDAQRFADLVEQLPDSELSEDFVDGKYGSYYRNIQGVIEHTHYHLGQIALIRKIILQSGPSSS